MSNISIVIIVIATFLILGIVLYFFTRNNIWNQNILEADEHIVYTENFVSLNIKQSNYVVKGLNLILTNKRMFLLRGKYKYITLYFDETNMSQKMKKSISSSRYHLFLAKEGSHIKNDDGQYIFSFTGKTFIGQEAPYELFLQDGSFFEKVLK